MAISHFYRNFPPKPDNRISRTNNRHSMTKNGLRAPVVIPFFRLSFHSINDVNSTERRCQLGELTRCTIDIGGGIWKYVRLFLLNARIEFDGKMMRRFDVVSSAKKK